MTACEFCGYAMARDDRYGCPNCLGEGLGDVPPIAHQTFYSDNDPYCAQWLRNLIDAGHIAPGFVDDRDIRALVEPGASGELDAFTHCHFFAGIGGWSYALQLAGWPADRPVWTGSCPCQPYSKAGRGAGHKDERDLWPTWARLIRERRPRVVFGEQIADAGGLAWLDVVCTDLENIGYAVAPIDFPAAGIGAPHVRPRIFFVGDASGTRLPTCEFEAVQGSRRPAQRRTALQSGATSGAWADAEWIACTDGKARPTQPGVFPLADGLPERVGKLRAYGNAIVPQAAALVIQAYMQSTAATL